MSVVKKDTQKTLFSTDISTDLKAMWRFYNGAYGAVFTAVLVVFMDGETVDGSMQPQVTCQENNMAIELDTNMYSHLNLSSFHLRKSSCVGKANGGTIKLTTPLNGCETTSKQTDETITYQNEVRADMIGGNSNTTNATITRKDAFILPFNCTYKRRKYVGVSFKPKRRVVGGEGAFGNFTFLMDLYSNKNYNHAYNDSEYPMSVQLNDRLYIKYRVLSDDGDLYVFAERCLATTTPSESSQPNYVFLDKGCTIDDTLAYNYTASREHTFSIKAFRFFADYKVVYLHCLLLVCHSSYDNTTCALGCGHGNRKRRDTSRDDGSQESNLYHLSSGTITVNKNTETPSGSNAPQSVTVIALSSAVGALLLGCCVLLVLLRYKKRKNTKPFGPTPLKAFVNAGVNGEDDPVNLRDSNHVEVHDGDGSQ